MSSVVRAPFVRVRYVAPVLVAAALVCGLFALSSPGSASTADEATLASLVNGARQGAGLAPQAVSGALSDVARAHSAAMASSGTLSHTGDLAGSAGAAAAGWTSLAENVAVAGSVTEAHSVIMGSAAHRANVLGDFTVLGVGVVTGSDGRVWVTETFARTAVVPAQAPAPEPIPEPIVTEAAVVPTAETTAVLASVTPAPAPEPTKPVRRAAAARPTRPARSAPAPAPARAAVASQESSCLPPQAQPQGQGHAYGRCGEVPRGR